MKIRSGTAIVLGLAGVLVVGWFAYRAYIPPAWLRGFAEDIALRATPDPNAPPPRDTREAMPRPASMPHPFICFAQLVKPLTWDRMIVVPSGGDPTSVLEEAGVTADEADATAARMREDPRYQLIVLTARDKLVSRAWFYTFWGDLSKLAGDGFTPGTAVFTAAVKDGTHMLTPVRSMPPVCRGES